VNIKLQCTLNKLLLWLKGIKRKEQLNYSMKDRILSEV